MQYNTIQYGICMSYIYRVSQVFWDPIKNPVSPRSALLEAVYLEALLYTANMCSGITMEVR